MSHLRESEQYELTCSICLDQVLISESLNTQSSQGKHDRDMSATALSCGHIFHNYCINSWLNQKSNMPECPYCKAKVNPRSVKKLMLNMVMVENQVSSNLLKPRGVDACAQILENDPDLPSANDVRLENLRKSWDEFADNFVVTVDNVIDSVRETSEVQSQNLAANYEDFTNSEGFRSFRERLSEISNRTKQSFVSFGQSIEESIARLREEKRESAANEVRNSSSSADKFVIV